MSTVSGSISPADQVMIRRLHNSNPLADAGRLVQHIERKTGRTIPVEAVQVILDTIAREEADQPAPPPSAPETPGTGRKISDDQKVILQRIVDRDPDASVAAMAAAFVDETGRTISHGTVARFLKNEVVRPPSDQAPPAPDTDAARVGVMLVDREQARPGSRPKPSPVSEPAPPAAEPPPKPIPAWVGRRTGRCRVSRPATPSDPELAAMANLVKALEGLDPDAARRALSWAAARFCEE